MALIRFSAVIDGQSLPFSATSDRLVFDDPLATAAGLRLVSVPGGLSLTLAGKTILLQMMVPGHISLSNLIFADKSTAILGDMTAGTIADGFSQSYDFSGSPIGRYIDGLGGADLVVGSAGNDTIVGNGPLEYLPEHVSQVGGTGSPTSSFLPTVSADGRLVAFSGGWVEFGSAGNNGVDVVVKNMASGTVTNENRAIDGTHGRSGAGDPVISADGRWIAFQSSSDLRLESAPSQTVFLADTASPGVLVASSTAGGAYANGPSGNPDISADGRYVVFESRATNLAPGAEDTHDDIYLKDMANGAITRISSAGGADANSGSIDPAISANGRYVVFASNATDLTQAETGNGCFDIYLWDRSGGALKNVTAGKGGVSSSFEPDVAQGQAGGPSKGGRIVFTSEKALVAGDTNNTRDVYAYDIASKAFTRVSERADGSQALGASQDAAISDDGRFVVFRSFANDLVAGDSNGYPDLFVKDLETGAIALVSGAPDGPANQAVSGAPAISSGGDWIVFSTSASNLAPSDANGGFLDVYRVANPLLFDTLMGGKGDDIYILQRPDLVIERPGEGRDTVMASFDYALATNLENLVLTGTDHIDGTGNGRDNVLTGNSGRNRLDGKGGNDTASYASASGPVTVSLAIAAGQDTGDGRDRLVSIENLTGSAQNDRLTGNDGANTLDGGAGRDFLEGGGGNDTYVVDDTGDILFEPGGQGTDTVIASVNWTLGATLENLALAGAATVGQGNSANNVIVGNALSNTLKGFAGNDRLSGGAGNDKLYGGAGNDRLQGDAGNDVLEGGDGDDTYVVDSSADIIVETATGTELVLSSVNWTLGALLENLTLTGTATLGQGNSGANRIVGNASANTLNGFAGDDIIRGGGGNDRIAGGQGNDRLTGGAGGDVFVFARAAGSDRITDFDARSALEKIDLSGVSDIASFADLKAHHLSQVGGNALISASGLTLVLDGVRVTDLDATDFLF